MRGLIQKDFCLLLQRSRVLLVLIGVGVLMGFSTDGSFVIGYMTMLFAILTIGTISYDEFDNGYPFLLTLPITRKTYVIGKYIFCLLGDLIGWVISVVIFIGCTMAKGGLPLPVQIMESLAFIPVFLLITAIMLPMQLKFGAEKSRVMIAVFGGGVFALGYIGKSFLPANFEIPAFLLEMSDLTAMVIFLIFGLAALFISYLCSLHIMEHKEF